MAKRIGFIGLGVMGKPMAKNLIAAGYHLTVHNRSQSSVNEVTEAGANMASSPREVAALSEVVITMLPDSSDSEKVILGENGALSGAKAGTIIIDMSSINPLVSQKIAQSAAAKGVEMLDAPVSGGEPGAIAATLAIMVGGKKDVFDQCSKILGAMGKSIVHVGEIGAGNVTKLCNQIIVASNIEAVSEALVLATKAGLDPEIVFQAIRGGLAGSNVLEAKAPMMISRNFAPGFRIQLHQKDLQNALNAGKDLGVPLPVTSLVQQMLGALLNDHKGNCDHSAIVNFIEGLAKVEVSRS